MSTATLPVARAPRHIFQVAQPSDRAGASIPQDTKIIMVSGISHQR